MPQVLRRQVSKASGISSRIEESQPPISYTQHSPIRRREDRVIAIPTFHELLDSYRQRGREGNRSCLVGLWRGPCQPPPTSVTDSDTVSRRLSGSKRLTLRPASSPNRSPVKARVSPGISWGSEARVNSATCWAVRKTGSARLRLGSFAPAAGLRARCGRAQCPCSEWRSRVRRLAQHGLRRSASGWARGACRCGIVLRSGCRLPGCDRRVWRRRAGRPPSRAGRLTLLLPPRSGRHRYSR